MSKRTDTNEATEFEGTVTVTASANPTDYGGGNIELEGALFTDTIMENTDTFGVNVEGTNFSDNYFTMIPITAPGNPPTGQQRVYVDIADNLLKTRSDTGSVTVYQPLTSKGDILTHNGTTQVRLPSGADGTYLVADNTVTAGIKWSSLSVAHSSLTGLTSGDDHTQYTLLAGRTGGQILTGGTASSNNLTIRSTSDNVKGSIIFDETTSSTSSTIGALRIAGGISISNVTDAIDSTNGGTITTAGGISTAKKLFVGTDTHLASVSGITTIGSSTALTVSSSGVLNVNNTTTSTSTVTGSVIIAGGLGVSGALFADSGNFTTLTAPHSGLTGLTTGDPHTQYPLLAGRTGGQILTGGTDSGNNLIIRSTSNVTKGSIVIDETTDSTSLITGAMIISGGLSVTKKLQVGDTLNMNSNYITNVLNPVNNNDVSNKFYVDNSLIDLNVSKYTIAATDSVGTLSSSFENGDIIDGVTLVTGDRILIKNQVSGIENGIYIVQVSGAPVRAPDFASGSTQNGVIILVKNGSVNSGTAWFVSNAVGSDTVGTDSLTIVSLEAIVAGTGLTRTNKTLSVNNSLTHVTQLGTLSSLNITGNLNITSLTASQAVFTDASKNLVSIGLNGSGNVVLTTSPTLVTPILGVASGTSLDLTGTTDATSSTVGGTLTVAGGTSVAKKLFVGTDTSLASSSGITTIGSSTVLTVSATGVLSINNTTGTSSSTTGVLLVSGGISISNTTDAVSVTNGGTITTAGGIAIEKKAFIGTDLSIGGTTLLSNYFQTVNITAPSNPPASNIRFYTDSADSLLKSKNSVGTITTYQPTTAKGDLQGHNGTTQVRVPVGLDNTYLIADSSQTAGLRWGNIVNIYYVYDQKTTGTNGGSSVTGSWLQRTLNTIYAYPSGTTKVTLSGSAMIFAPGVYKITASTPFSISNADIASRLYNVTNSTVALISTTSHADSVNGIWYSYIYGIITVTTTNTFRIEYRTDKATASGLGIASGFQAERYTHLEIQLIGYNV